MGENMNNLDVARRLEEWSIPEPNSGCRLWLGAEAGKGYGRISIGNKNFRAHRISWEVHRGPIPIGLVVCHKCDVRACINPEHLFLGSQVDNIIDAITKGRMEAFLRRPKPRGAASHRAKLSNEAAEEIRRRRGHRNGRQLAREFGVSSTTVYDLWRGRTYTEAP